MKHHFDVDLYLPFELVLELDVPDVCELPFIELDVADEVGFCPFVYFDLPE